LPEELLASLFFKKKYKDVLVKVSWIYSSEASMQSIFEVDWMQSTTC